LLVILFLAKLLENSKQVLDTLHETTASEMSSSLPLMSTISNHSVKLISRVQTKLCAKIGERNSYVLKRCYTKTLPQGLGILLLLVSESTTLGVNPQELLRRHK